LGITTRTEAVLIADIGMNNELAETNTSRPESTQAAALTENITESVIKREGVAKVLKHSFEILLKRFNAEYKFNSLCTAGSPIFTSCSWRNFLVFKIHLF